MNKTLILSVLLFFSASSCSPVPDNPSGFVSLSPSATEIIYELGAEKNLKAVSDYCDWPPGAESRQSAGGLINPSLEMIVYINPEIIFTLSEMPPQITESLARSGLTVVSTGSGGLEGIFSDIREISRICGKESRGEEVISRIRSEIRHISGMLEGSAAKKVYLEISADPVMSPAGRSYINEMISLAGGENVASEEKRDYLLTSLEYIVEKQPEVILILSESGPSRIEYLRSILKDSVPASREGNIHYIENKDPVLRPGPRVAEGIKQLALHIHPGRFNEK